HIANLAPKNDVAILFSIDSYHGIKAMPFDDKVDYDTVARQMYRALFRLDVGVDFVFPDDAGFGAYKLVVVPSLYVADAALLARLSDYVKNGGHVLLGFKSGFCTENATVRSSMMPGPLREAAGILYQEFASLKQKLPLVGDPFHVGK